MKDKQEIAIVDIEYLEDKIYVIRGQKVMLDSDLAKIYGYSTKAFNQQVQRNIEKFDDSFMFQLDFDEIPLFLRSQFVTLNIKNNKQGMHYKYRPFVFTEEGVYMLMTVLKGPLATKQSIALIKAFKTMKDYIFENNDLKIRTTNIEKDIKTIKDNNRQMRMDLDKVIDCFTDNSVKDEYLILNGERIKADLAYESIFKKAKKSIIYIDDYIGIKTFDLLSYAKKGVSITIVSDNLSSPPIKDSVVNDFIKTKPSNILTLIKSSGKCHDRFIILDFNTDNESIYLSGSSLKDAGNKITTITKIIDTSIYKSTIKGLLKGSILKLK